MLCVACRRPLDAPRFGSVSGSSGGSSGSGSSVAAIPARVAYLVVASNTRQDLSITRTYGLVEE